MNKVRYNVKRACHAAVRDDSTYRHILRNFVTIRYLLTESMATHSADFWNAVGATDADVERVYGFLLERGAPTSIRDLTIHLIEGRRREEEKRFSEAAARRIPAYQPKQTFTVGQRLTFPAWNDREGVVKKVREGDNPRLGNFQVIAVKFDEARPAGDRAPQESRGVYGRIGDLREFAAAYTLPHPLNQDPLQDQEAFGLTVEQVIAQHGEAIRARLAQRLSVDKEFVHVDDQWFLKELLPPVNPGYLNLAEAAIEQAGDALRVGDLIKILDLGANKTAAAFAFSHALANDSRFDDVGPTGDTRWFLTRLELPAAREYPALLQAAPAKTFPLSPELEAIAAELFDEADLNGDASSRAMPNANLRPRDDASNGVTSIRDEITLILTYPHRRAGTLPLTAPVRALLPDFRQNLKINFIDAATEEKFVGYAVAQGHYLAGLGDWFNARRLSPGAYVTLKRGADPLTLLIDYQPQRERSLWVRAARAMNARLTFTQEKRPLSHKYDEEMLIVVADPVGIDKLTQTDRAQLTLAALLEEIFPELAKLSGAGRVHAKTLYSAVNFIRRAGPRAVFSALTESRAFSSAGGGYFVLHETRTR